MSDADEYLRNARECRTVAEQADTPERKANFLRMAETWEHLARQTYGDTLELRGQLNGDPAAHRQG
jgi:hypothetical protein